MKNENRKIGNEFEHRLCVSLSLYGFWAHNMAQNKQGQPFDVIAARNGRSYPIDCKVCEKDVFKLSRIEENQASAMTLWEQTGNGDGWFALEMSDGEVYFFTYFFLASLIQTSLSEAEIKQVGIPLRKWVEQCE